MKKISGILSALIIYMFFSITASAYFLTGNVTNETGSALENVYIINEWEGTDNNIYPKNDYYPFDCKYYINYSCDVASQENYTKTNSSGFYSLNLTSGYHNISIGFFPTYYTNASNVNIDSNKTFNVNLIKKPTGTITGCVYVFGGINPCTLLEGVKIISSNRIRWFF
ncbi:MAG: hypothetical protein PHP06_05865 [Clostridia bacterium]|nr:hypothetical protein [Clostridia bacterium]